MTTRRAFETTCLNVLDCPAATADAVRAAVAALEATPGDLLTLVLRRAQPGEVVERPFLEPVLGDPGHWEEVADNVFGGAFARRRAEERERY
jgi:hypothetical protein